MTGAVCPKCGGATNDPRLPKCDRAGCPGNETLKPFVHVMPDISKCRDGADHDFRGWRSFYDGNGGEQVCAKCGVGAMAWSMAVGP